MSILPLAAVLPAATKVARTAVAGSVEVGKNLFNLMASSPAPAAERADSMAGTPKSDSLEDRTKSFSQRLAGWLRQQPWFTADDEDAGPLEVRLALDQLDRPQATLNGQSSAELDAALAKDPQWLDEFRNLALDRIEQQTSLDTTSPPQSLTIRQTSATIDTAHRWGI